LPHFLLVFFFYEDWTSRPSLFHRTLCRIEAPQRRRVSRRQLANKSRSSRRYSDLAGRSDKNDCTPEKRRPGRRIVPVLCLGIFGLGWRVVRFCFHRCLLRGAPSVSATETGRPLLGSAPLTCVGLVEVLLLRELMALSFCLHNHTQSFLETCVLGVWFPPIAGVP